jgi:hypothetical protein
MDSEMALHSEMAPDSVEVAPDSIEVVADFVESLCARCGKFHPNDDHDKALLPSSPPCSQACPLWSST